MGKGSASLAVAAARASVASTRALRGGWWCAGFVLLGAECAVYALACGWLALRR